MSAERVTYLDSSAIVKLVVMEAESPALRKYLRRRKHSLVTSALARTEVARALLPFGTAAIARGEETMSRLDVVRINDRILRSAGTLLLTQLRSLDAIHLATAAALGADLARLCTYDDRMAGTATELGMTVVAPR